LIQEFAQLAAHLRNIVAELIQNEKDKLLILARSLDPHKLMEEGIWAGNLDATAPRKARQRY
jgi:hypothetical protein